MRIARSTARTWLLFAAKLAVFGLVLWFIRDTLLKALTQIGHERWRLSPWWLLWAGVLYAIAMLPSSWFWFRTLRALGQEVRLGEAMRALCIGQLGKYVPGKAMVVILRTAMVRSHRVHAGVAAASVFFETLTTMAVGAFLAAGILAWRLSHGSLRLDDRIHPQTLLWGTLGMMGVAGLPTLPPIFRRLATLAGVTRSDPATAEKLRGLGLGTLALGWVAAAAAWALLASSLWATFRAVGVQQPNLLAGFSDYVAAVALATVAGFLAMLPAGLGVRDAILVALLVTLLAAEEGHALVIAGTLRMVWLAAELAVAGILYIGLRPAQSR